MTSKAATATVLAASRVNLHQQTIRETNNKRYTYASKAKDNTGVAENHTYI
jgi:hypothetical protein